MTRRLMILVSICMLAGAGVGLAQAVRNVPRISIDEVKALMANKQVLLVDVRDAAAFVEGHMPGAINIPLPEVVQHAEKLKKEKRTIVTYCA